MQVLYVLVCIFFLCKYYISITGLLKRNASFIICIIYQIITIPSLTWFTYRFFKKKNISYSQFLIKRRIAKIKGEIIDKSNAKDYQTFYQESKSN
jgi:hypothetical protein